MEDKAQKDNKHQEEEEEDFESLLEDCTKGLDKKLNIAQPQQPGMQTQPSLPKKEESIQDKDDEEGGEPLPEDVKEMQKMME